MENMNYVGPATKSEGLRYLPINEELAKDIYVLRSNKVFNYEDKLRKMELINPSISDLEEIVAYKSGVDFMTNQPVYKYKENNKNCNMEEQKKDFEALQDLSAELRYIEEEGPIVFEKF